MLPDSFIKDLEKKMEGTVLFFKKDMLSVKVGKANPSVLDSIMVETPYGTNMRLREISTWTSPDPRQLVVNPFDKQLTSAIAKSIEKANIGLKVSNEGTSVRLTAPLIDESIRKEALKICKKKAENARISIRSIRKEGNTGIKNMDLPEDLVRKQEKEIQKLTDKFCSQIDSFLEDFEKDLMNF